MKYTVRAELLNEVTKKLNAMKRKADRYGVFFEFSEGEHHPACVPVMALDPVTYTICKVDEYMVEAVDINVEHDGLIKASGWEVLAMIEHGENGNIVHCFGEATEEQMKEWHTCEGRCDHCHTNRFRKTTFIVRHENGDIKQVGKSCLKDYTGINGLTAVYWAQVTAEMESTMWIDRSECNSLPRLYNVKTIIAHAVDSISKNGYVKSSMPNSTRSCVHSALQSGKIPSDKATKKAEDIMVWLTTTDFDFSDFEYNASVMAKEEWAKVSYIGILAYMPISYDKAMERIAKEKARQEEHENAVKTSEYVGIEKQRLTINLKSCKLCTSWENGYGGFTHLYKFEDMDGNQLVWFASSPFDEDDKDVHTIKATVKSHNERDGVKQTIITRCKVC